MQLKRLWDTDGKKIVFAEGPSGHMCQVWTDVSGDHLYIYDKSQWLSYNGTSPAGMEYDRSNWVELVDQEVGFYDTNEPTDLYAWDSGDKASYKFVDWDGTVLKSGVVEEGETPTAPADPTRAATAQYTYTFAGWNPTVGPISKKTTFTATYTATVNEYTITWVDGDGNTLDTDTVAYGDTPEYTGSTPTKTATAQYTYTWDEGWTPSVVAVTGDATYTATFTATVNQYTVTIQSNNTDYGTVDESSVTVDYGTAISASNNVLTIGETTITATAETGYEFSSWGILPATVTGDLSITATFESPIETLYSGANGTIIHDKEAGEITYTYTGETTADLTNGDTITVADKNIGATSYDINSPDSQGYCYQWGNNYGFPNTGAVQTSSTQVDASSYTASTYSSDTFITGGYWDSSKNGDLWGGVTGTDIAKKGPCPNGYHIPSGNEMKKVLNMVAGIMGLSSVMYVDLYTYMLLPIANNLNRNSGDAVSTSGGIWACTDGPNYPGEDGEYMTCGGVDNNVLETYRCKGYQIRPFKNASI